MGQNYDTDKTVYIDVMITFKASASLYYFVIITSYHYMIQDFINHFLGHNVHLTIPTSWYILCVYVTKVSTSFVDISTIPVV